METIAEDITPDDIDTGFVPRLVPDLVETAVGTDVIVLGGPTQLMVLNPIAALVYQFVDGWTPREPLVVGDVLDDFTLPDLDGNDVALSSFRGRQVLLVNWSPGCG